MAPGAIRLESPNSSTTNLLAPRSGQPSYQRSPSPALSDSLSDKFSLAADPREWGAALWMNVAEPDDALHNPDPRRDRKNDRGGSIFTARGLGNLGFLFLLCMGMLMLFAGFPLVSHFTKKQPTTNGGFNLGGINATGQLPEIPGNWGLIDKDTPQDAYTKSSYQTGESWELVFSDEFNQDGRTFYPGDDPYWEAPDLHYWQTNDLEWYDPEQATTKDGYLQLKLDQVDDPANNHNMSYKSGMIQTWNKFCFTGGLIETKVVLPGSSTVNGLWPAVWTMGNLGRAGFGASLEGMWPYSYDSCDVGTLPNQTHPGTQTPLAAVENGDPQADGALSYLPGQRLSACTCPGESHPGPMRQDGSYVGRSAPEIDIFEALVDTGIGKVSQSCQWAPFNAEYNWKNTTANLKIYNDTGTVLNQYKGGAFQQTTSGLTDTDQNCYEQNTNCGSIYGFEYKPGVDEAYITWITDGKPAWTINADGMGPDTATEIGQRLIPVEPMYIIANLGFSLNFGGINFDELSFPTTMKVDYIRVYQPSNAKNIGCDPPDYPTAAYINTYLDAYTNPNFTTWKEDFKQPFPKNSMLNRCT